MARLINPKLARSTSAWLTGAPITLNRNRLPLPIKERLQRKKESGITSYGGAVFVGFENQPKGQITALDGESGRILWKYRTDGQMLAGLVPTKSGLLFAGDVRGNLFAFDARSGSVLNRIDVNGALNGGLISYAVDGTQYVAAAVGGVTLNPAGVGGALKVSVYGLNRGRPSKGSDGRSPPAAVYGSCGE